MFGQRARPDSLLSIARQRCQLHHYSASRLFADTEDFSKMTKRPGIVGMQPFCLPHQIQQTPHGIPTLPRNSSETMGELDCSVADMQRFLRELVELAGQVDQSHAAPVLELEFGEVLTRTTVSTNGKSACLSIIALLPRSEQLNYQTEPLSAPLSSAAGKVEFLWHADEGRYVVIRNIPLTDLPDEPSVMDAIMDTSDEAKAWFASAHASASASR
jgi:hypothetical protein